jgi:hypothetical protein
MPRIGIFSLQTDPCSNYFTAANQADAIDQFQRLYGHAKIISIANLTKRKMPWYPED